MVKPVKFTRDSGCLARDEFLVISEGDHMLRYIFVIFFLLLGTVPYFHIICRPMLVHRMTLVSFRLFRKNLGNLREFFGQMVHRPPGKKNARTPMTYSSGRRSTFPATVYCYSLTSYILQCCPLRDF